MLSGIPTGSQLTARYIFDHRLLERQQAVISRMVEEHRGCRFFVQNTCRVISDSAELSGPVR